MEEVSKESDQTPIRQRRTTSGEQTSPNINGSKKKKKYLKGINNIKHD